MSMDNIQDRQIIQEADPSLRSSNPLFRKTALFLAGVAWVSACSGGAEPNNLASEELPVATTTSIAEVNTSVVSEIVLPEGSPVPASSPKEIREANPSAGNSIANIEGTDSDTWYWRSRVGNLNSVSYPGRFSEIYKGNVELVDENNPLSILEYHYLNIIGAVCTGDEERFTSQYYRPEDKAKEGDIYNLYLSEIRKHQNEKGTTKYSLDPKECASYSFSFDSDSLSNVVWGNENKTVSFDIQVYDKLQGKLVDSSVIFQKEDDAWKLSSISFIK